ncbi:hypothetical protein MSAN_00414100 [Mycena sanguinolenta]|uniref:Uncharacterized protein n=1 Tax=Mycena sanguinolenta TaxID=230812 RepID=A0A8H6ZA19_9AGAR|nr:hypothetical protein MSAN_00414100 [Mycena sanguinolenta]
MSTNAVKNILADRTRYWAGLHVTVAGCLDREAGDGDRRSLHLQITSAFFDELASLASFMASHKTELRITVVDEFDWPALQECSILTPYSLCPRDVTVDGDEISISHLTPNSITGRFAWADRSGKTPTTSHTFGFPLSAVSDVFKLSPDSQTPLEKQKRRLRRYTAAESLLARIPAPSPSSPSQVRANAAKFAASSVAMHVRDARQSLNAVRKSGRRDSTRWMAEHRLASLEAIQAELSLSSGAQVRLNEDDARREANLVRFLAMRKSDGRVPVFTRPPGRRPPVVAAGDVERRHITAKSPMQLQAEVMPVRQTARSEWPWETRVRSVLLNPPKPLVSAPLRPASSMALSTPTSDTFSSITDPETPLTEFEEEEEDEDDYEDYPVFRVDSALSEPVPRPRKPLPVPAMSLPRPISTNITPDASYAWLAQSATWGASASAWHGDGWEVPTSAASSTASPTSISPSSRAPSPAVAPPTPMRAQSRPLPAVPVHRFWSRERQSLQAPPLRPISEVAARSSAMYGVRPLPPPPASASAPAPPPRTPPRKSGFFSGLVRRKTTERDLELEREREQERNKLRKPSSMRSSISGSPSSQTFFP